MNCSGRAHHRNSGDEEKESGGGRRGLTTLLRLPSGHGPPVEPPHGIGIGVHLIRLLELLEVPEVRVRQGHLDLVVQLLFRVFRWPSHALLFLHGPQNIRILGIASVKYPQVELNRVQ